MRGPIRTACAQQCENHARREDDIRLSWIKDRDAVGALLLIAFGGFVLYVGRAYEFGTVTDMGPGYFPALLGVIIALLGFALLVRSALGEKTRIEFGPVLPCVVVTGAIFLFALLVDRVGLVVATAVIVMVSRLAARPYRPVETGILATALVVTVVLVFVDLLALPLRVW